MVTIQVQVQAMYQKREREKKSCNGTGTPWGPRDATLDVPHPRGPQTGWIQEFARSIYTQSIFTAQKTKGITARQAAQTSVQPTTLASLSPGWIPSSHQLYVEQDGDNKPFITTQELRRLDGRIRALFLGIDNLAPVLYGPRQGRGATARGASPPPSPAS